MGFTVSSTEFVTQARQSGVRFDSSLTLGRQHMAVSPQKAKDILQRFGAWPPPGDPQAFMKDLAETLWRFEVFARALGARQVTACDISGYEGATLIHDLNQPIPSEHEEQYDAVIDNGTLEHIFNFPVAMANCMRMVKLNGHFILITVANNSCGHGFYQFSPELFFRIFSGENGFSIKKVVMGSDVTAGGKIMGIRYPFRVPGAFYEVHDPAVVQKRVELINDRPTVLMVLAQKSSRKPLFAKTPLQSDYVPQWTENKSLEVANMQSLRGGQGRLASWLFSTFSEEFCRVTLPRLAVILDPFRWRRWLRRNSFANREAYTRIKNHRP